MAHRFAAGAGRRLPLIYRIHLDKPIVGGTMADAEPIGGFLERHAFDEDEPVKVGFLRLRGMINASAISSINYEAPSALRILAAPAARSRGVPAAAFSGPATEKATGIVNDGGNTPSVEDEIKESIAQMIASFLLAAGPHCERALRVRSLEIKPAGTLVPAVEHVLQLESHLTVEFKIEVSGHYRLTISRSAASTASSGIPLLGGNTSTVPLWSHCGHSTS
jgi:hypothetical protein